VVVENVVEMDGAARLVSVTMFCFNSSSICLLRLQVLVDDVCGG
jgi:hypothetical protein